MRDESTVGAILAGGLARRLGGGDKALRIVGGRSVLAWQIERVGPQVRRLVLNANNDPARFAAFGLAVVPDCLPHRPGPLAGVLAALDWAALVEPHCAWVLTVPGDAPFLPGDLVARLHAGRREAGAELSHASSGGRAHPVVALWPVSLRLVLREAVAGEGLRKMQSFMARRSAAAVAWATQPVDPFFNVNTTDDLETANLHAAALSDDSCRAHKGVNTPPCAAPGTSRKTTPLTEEDDSCASRC